MEGQRDVADRPVAVLGDDDVGLAIACRQPGRVRIDLDPETVNSINYYGLDANSFNFGPATITVPLAANEVASYINGITILDNEVL